MHSWLIQLWRKAPFLRLVILMMMGIIIQWYSQADIFIWLCISLFAIVFALTTRLFSSYQHFRYPFISGISIVILSISFGVLLTWINDIRNNKNWFGHSYNNELFLVSLDEPLTEKANSFKATASVRVLLNDHKPLPVRGKIIIYFKKDTLLTSLTYGSQLVFRKEIQEIRNAGNPGGFDYKRYCLFQGITHQVYLLPGEFELLNDKKEKWLAKFIFNLEEWVIGTLRKYITEPKELGLAEALLIGYKDDLDKSLIQSYTNTGVVHVIAISGLHLGIVYLLLGLICKPFKRIFLRTFIIVAGLWIFTLLAGAQPSVLRSAVMFTCIVIGESIGRRTNIYNTLACSAFLLLCYNPYWLWDIGFQLSYTAVLSIVIFMRPIYNWFYFSNKAVDFAWKLNAVTLSAQLLTTPLSIFHFHQFPNYFFLTNFIAVPLSSIILIGEIILCVLSIFPILSRYLADAITSAIRLMNNTVENVEAIPYSVWQGLQINCIQTILLYILIAFLAYWLMERSMLALKFCLPTLLAFTVIRSASFIHTGYQTKMIVYNIPKKLAIDFMCGREYKCRSDPSLLNDQLAFNLHLKPCRILHRSNVDDKLVCLYFRLNYITFHNKRVVVIEESMSAVADPTERQEIDLLIISGNARFNLIRVSQFFEIKKIVFAATLPQWRVNTWKKDCTAHGISYHDVSSMGAFVMNLR